MLNMMSATVLTVHAIISAVNSQNNNNNNNNNNNINNNNNNANTNMIMVMVMNSNNNNVGRGIDDNDILSDEEELMNNFGRVQCLNR